MLPAVRKHTSLININVLEDLCKKIIPDVFTSFLYLYWCHNKSIIIFVKTGVYICSYIYLLTNVWANFSWKSKIKMVLPPLLLYNIFLHKYIKVIFETKHFKSNGFSFAIIGGLATGYVIYLYLMYIILISLY